MAYDSKPPMFPWFGLWENTTKSGDPYLVGYIGDCKVLFFKNKDQQENKPQWQAYITERPRKPKVAADDIKPDRDAGNGGRMVDDAMPW